MITRLLKAGSEENTLATCLYQLEQGHQVWVVHGDEFDPTYRETLPATLRLVEVSSMVHPIRPPKDFQALLDLRRLYREIGVDVIHTHQSKAGILGRAAAAGLRVPAVIHTVHIAPFLNVGGLTKAFYVVVERLCASISDVIINVSEGMRDACLENGVGRPDQQVVIHSGMPVQKFAAAKPPADWRARIGGWAGERPRMMLMLAAFEPRKRQEAFLRAAARHLQANPNIVLLFGGSGIRMAAAKDLAQSLGVAGQVRFLGHDPAPEELIALSDVCLLTSEREGLPRVAVQYMAGGRPVVISDLPGITEIVHHDINGLIGPADDLDQVASMAFGLINDASALTRLKDGAAKTDVSTWAQERMGMEIQRAYDAVLARKAGASVVATA
ncbi:glycosyltransferase [Brevundimonas sp. TSRC1-1]|uniref:glycosyltransferase n=1 Tax=Brevundimonas sp. TSRC1-1 TaxID=2804562 RepID=UPI003CF7F8FF